MSKHHVSHSKDRYLRDVKAMSKEELINLYGIDIEDDGRVFDSTENRYFDSLTAWAIYMAEQENDDMYGSFTKIGHKGRFDDDY